MHKTHGMTRGPDGKWTKLFIVWLNMRSRCNNPKRKDYKYYGGRGIKVCKRWSSFAFFAADVGIHPGKGWTLDRKNNNGNYTPKNIRWSTIDVQRRNTNRHHFSLKRASLIRSACKSGAPQRDIAKHFGVSQSSVSMILNKKRCS